MDAHFFSHPRGAQYYVGNYIGNKFYPIRDGHGRFNHGPLVPERARIGKLRAGNLHAPSVMLDQKGRRIAFFNVMEGDEIKRSWDQVMTLPRVLSLDTDSKLLQEPVEEIAALRRGNVHFENLKIPANGELPLPGAKGNAIEIRAVVEVQKATQIGLRVLRSPDGAEETVVSFYPSTNTLSLDTSRSSLRPEAHLRAPETGILALKEGEPLELRIFIDRSVIEVFANGRQALVTRMYPERADSTGIQLFTRGAEAQVRSMDVWQMQDIWAAR